MNWTFMYYKTNFDMNADIPNINYGIGTFISALVSVRLPWQTFCSNFSSFLHDDQGPMELFFEGLDLGLLTNKQTHSNLLTLAYWLGDRQRIWTSLDSCCRQLWISNVCFLPPSRKVKEIIFKWFFDYLKKPKKNPEGRYDLGWSSAACDVDTSPWSACWPVMYIG